MMERVRDRTPRTVLCSLYFWLVSESTPLNRDSDRPPTASAIIPESDVVLPCPIAHVRPWRDLQILNQQGNQKARQRKAETEGGRERKIAESS